MTHEEWLKWRSEGLGSSDAPIIMLTFPFGKTPYMLWEEKILKTEKASMEMEMIMLAFPALAT